MNLSEVREDIIEAIMDNLCVIAGGSEMKKLGNIFEEVIVNFQALAICNLLVNFDSKKFYKNLIDSAFALHYFLKRSKLEQNNSQYLAISRNQSFFDAIAGNQLDLAVKIVSLSPKTWIPDGEYEDDFCYYFFFHNFILGFNNADKSKLRMMIVTVLYLCWEILLLKKKE